jgi:hypothetical protein
VASTYKQTLPFIYCLPCIVIYAATFPPHFQDSVSPDLHYYLGARTILNYSAQETLKTYPELKGFEFTESQEELPTLLQRIGDTVEAMFANFPRTTSLERVSQERTEPGRPQSAHPALNSQLNWDWLKPAA